jgi:hypothetical protein
VSVSSISGTGFAGLAAVRARMFALSQQRIMVGVPSGRTEPDGTSTALVAATVEFGNPAVGSPERPVLRHGIKRAMPGIVSLASRTTKAVVDGRMAVGHALDLVGLYAVGEIKTNQVTEHWAPNADSTIARKGSDKPTIDTGAYRQAITHVVVPA